MKFIRSINHPVWDEIECVKQQRVAPINLVHKTLLAIRKESTSKPFDYMQRDCKGYRREKAKIVDVLEVLFFLHIKRAKLHSNIKADFY